MRFSERSPLNNPVKPSSLSAVSPVDVIVTVLLPWLLFSLIVCLFTFAYEDFAPLVWALVMASLLLSALFVAMGTTMKKPMQVVLGLLIVISVSMAIPVGLYIESGYMLDFWRIDNGASYRQVSTADASSAHADATLLEFTPGTRVDTDKSIGYMKRGTVYCVAPVVNAKASNATGPQYWATGTDCCAQSGGFACGDVKDPAALSGVVVRDDKDNLASAVRMAISTHGLEQPTGRTVFVEWRGSGLHYKEGLWSTASLLVVVSCTVQFGISACAGICAARMKL